MEEDQDYNIDRINELVEEFKEHADRGDLGFYDSEDLEYIVEELIARFDFPYATEAVELGMSLYPDSFDFCILNAKKLIMEMELERAGEALDAIERDFPPYAEFYLEKAFYCKMSGQGDEALPLLRKAYELEPDDPEINFMLGGEYVKAQQFERAYRHISYAMREDDLMEDQLFTVSYIFEDEHTYDQAVWFFKRLTEEFPLSKNGWFALGLAYSWIKDGPNAMEAYQNTISLDEEASTAYFNIGNIHFEAGDYVKALEYYEKTFQLDDRDYHALTGMGDCYFEMYIYKDAIEKYQAALEIEPNDMDAIMGIITCLKETGRSDEAEAFIQKSFSLSPQSFELLFNVLPFYDDAEQIKKLKELFQLTIKQIDDKEGFLKFFTSYCAGNKELSQMGISLLEEFLDDPDVAMVLPYLLAALHYVCGHVAEGNNYLRNALTINYEEREMFLAISPSFEANPVIMNMIDAYGGSLPL
ncbi:MAG: tetratricopeptide repeat protein [Bacteroidales bacterium]|nr:tetratricopeptide repeat protein [Bacteroidales bacterium]